MKNRNEYASQVTDTYDLSRIIYVNKNQFKNWGIGDIYNNYENAESWSSGNEENEFCTENKLYNEVKVVLIASKIPAHKVDYNNKNEVKDLTAVESEDEYLVSSDTKLKIKYISSDDDYLEMKYYIVELELA